MMPATIIGLRRETLSHQFCAGSVQKLRELTNMRTENLIELKYEE
jgi:hypothetical protein